MESKAIETQYNGYRFRSRLEARWAVFFDHIGVKYRYEAEGYDCDGLWYLPDFYLPVLDVYIEIKGSLDPDVDFIKPMALANTNGVTVYLFCGDIWIPHFHTISGLLIRPGMKVPTTRHWWTECPECKEMGISGFGDARYFSCDCMKESYEGFPAPNFTSPRLVEGYQKARQARFEYGETPTTGITTRWGVDL